ncbi:MAG: hypothetical protein WA110_00555 [Anaerolineaceae bacterium]
MKPIFRLIFLFIAFTLCLSLVQNKVSASDVPQGMDPPQQTDALMDSITTVESAFGIHLAFDDMDRTPYNLNLKMVDYTDDLMRYQFESISGQLVEIMPIDDQKMIYNFNPLYSEDELQKMAIDFILWINPEIDFDSLNPSVGNKDQMTYFFRWEDDSLLPFIQVGFSAGGEFLNYTNSLGLKPKISLENSINSLIGIYANGGMYATTSGAYNTVDNAGYCSTQGSWCTPKNFYYATTVDIDNQTYTAHTRWMPYIYHQISEISVFVPSTHGTTQEARYRVNDESLPNNFYINQLIYYDTWVKLTSQTYYDLNYILTDNAVDASGTEISWDEIMLYNPYN